MRYDLHSETVHWFKPVRTPIESRSRVQSSFRYCSKWDRYFSFDRIDEAEHRSVSPNVVSFDAFLCHKGSLEIPWKEFVCQTGSLDNVRINTKSIFFSNVTRYVKALSVEDTRFLLQADKALESISRRIQALSEEFFYNIRSIQPNRTPGFVIDGWVIIPEYDRTLEYKIYRELGNILRNNPNLLFNIHTMARKGRELEKIVPKGFRRYSSWSGYIC